MEADSGIKLAGLKVDGGASANNFLMQYQADVIAERVLRPACIETTAMGAAFLAGLATGFWNSIEEVCLNWAVERVFEPDMDEQTRAARLKGWSKAVRYSFDWAKDE